ncbi:MAG TPA: PQQ-dependent sugar dehydrogenase [Gammaproteobacteria bacterium]|nr:PQQ-dependent sugar dehydrogenase [Gammaproteobacteria bacterium]
MALLCTWGLRLEATYMAANHCDRDIGGVSLPTGFCATVFADHLGVARHMAVDADGDVYVALQQPVDGHGIAALEDSHGSGHADVVRGFGDAGGSGTAVGGGYLYFASDTAVFRYPLKPGELLPTGPAETVVDGFPAQDEHAAKTIALDGAGHLYVNVGAPSNACQQDDRVPGSPGIKPCPLLAEHGGIWRFDADRTRQKFPQDGMRYATGIRNAVAITWNSGAGALYALQMGRDQLFDNWPKLYTVDQNAELPAEEFLRVREGDDYGWPYCYYDGVQKKKLLAPEYGGDGKTVGDCDKYAQPIADYPGHWAPESVLFYTGKLFPAHYQGGAFIAFHGSWNRAPLPQAGYKVIFQPFKDGLPAGPYEVFADGFAGSEDLRNRGDARFRPMGLTQGPDGALYIGDTQQGRIWRVVATTH